MLDTDQQTPVQVRALAERLGARPDGRGVVRLRQVGEMRDGPRDRPLRFRAGQTIRAAEPAFRWCARTGPFGLVRVVDAFEHDKGELAVRLGGVVPLARICGGADLAKGELMRYLAELPWAPDAILQNRRLFWEGLGDRRLRVSCRTQETSASIDFDLDHEGRIVTAYTVARPRREGDRFIERPWAGRFSDYRRCEGRWLPFRAEVSWTVGDSSWVAWRGELVDWTCA